MKKGEQPELSARWRKHSQPDGLRSAGRREDALKDHEAARCRFEANDGEPEAEAASEAPDAADPGDGRA